MVISMAWNRIRSKNGIGRRSMWDRQMNAGRGLVPQFAPVTTQLAMDAFESKGAPSRLTVSDGSLHTAYRRATAWFDTLAIIRCARTHLTSYLAPTPTTCATCMNVGAIGTCVARNTQGQSSPLRWSIRFGHCMIQGSPSRPLLENWASHGARLTMFSLAGHGDTSSEVAR